MVSRCVSAAGVRFSVILFPAGSWASLTVGLPAKAGPRRGFRVSHARAAIGVGALSTPGTTVLILAGVAHRPAPAASQRHVPAPRHSIHRCGAPLDEASTRVQVLHPSDLPLACDPRMEQEPLGFPPSFAPRNYSQRTSGRGQVIEHGPETTLYVIDLASSPASFTQMRATSRRTRRWGSKFGAETDDAEIALWRA